MKKLSLEDSEALSSFAKLAILAGVIVALVAACFIWGPYVLLGFGLLGTAIGVIALMLLYAKPISEGEDGHHAYGPDIAQPRGTTAKQAEAANSRTEGGTFSESLRYVGGGGDGSRGHGGTDAKPKA